MKNVIVFSHEGSRYAVELRWVIEVFTLGFVTPVPGAPPALAGLVNLRGAITPVLDLAALLDPATPRGAGAREGDSAVLLEVEGTVAAIAIAAVDEVATLGPSSDRHGLLDSRGRVVAVLDPPELVHRALDAVNATRRLGLTGKESSGGAV